MSLNILVFCFPSDARCAASAKWLGASGFASEAKYGQTPLKNGTGAQWPVAPVTKTGLHFNIAERSGAPCGLGTITSQAKACGRAIRADQFWRLACGQQASMTVGEMRKVNQCGPN